MREMRGSAPTAAPEEFETEVMVGAELARFVQGVARWGKRDRYPALMDFIRSDERDRVFVVYGLRRTGKTTMLRQATDSCWRC